MTKTIRRTGVASLALLAAALAAAGTKAADPVDETKVAKVYRDYQQTLVLKLFLGMEGEPVERVATDPMFQKKHDVICTFEEALEVIRKTDNLNYQIP